MALKEIPVWIDALARDVTEQIQANPERKSITVGTQEVKAIELSLDTMTRLQSEQRRKMATVDDIAHLAKEGRATKDLFKLLHKTNIELALIRRLLEEEN